MDWEGWYWPNHFGDPVAEHHAVRNDVGVWDESPLRKWDFKGPDALAAADRIFTNDMLGARGRPGALRALLRREREDGRRRHGLQVRGRELLGRSPRSTPTSTTSTTVVSGMAVEIEPITEKLPHVQLQGPRRASCSPTSSTRRSRSSGTSASCRSRSTSAACPCWVSRTGYSGELGYELFCRARLRRRSSGTR